METTLVTALVWYISYCNAPMFITDGKCNDGTSPHSLEIKLLDGSTSSKTFDPYKDEIVVNKLFIISRDGEEIGSVKASIVSAEEIKWLLQLIWPKN